MNFYRFRFIFLSVAIFLLSSVSFCFSSHSGSNHVLVLNSFNPGYSWTDKMLQGINDTFARSGLIIDTSVRFMDMKRIKRSDDYFLNLKQMLKSGYRDIRFDAVLACDNDALDFLRIYRDELFPGVPVVFSSINDYDKKMLDSRSDITGTSENTDYSGTIKAALSLLPATKTIVIVTDDTTTGKAHRSAIEKIRDSLPKNISIRFISFGEMTLDELGQTLSMLKNDSVVLLTQHFIDKNGNSHSLQKSTPIITAKSAVPVFVLTDSRMGLGAIGGVVVSGYHHGEAAAKMVVDILGGRNINSIPVMLESPNKSIFDHSVMERFRINGNQLPPGSIIINKPFSLLDRYRAELFSIAAIFILLCGFLFYLLFEIRKRRKTEASLRLTRISVDAASDAIFWITPDAQIVDVNEAACRSLGYTREELLKLSVYDVDCYYDAKTWPQHFAELRKCEAIKFESEQRTKDGRVFPVEIVANYIKNGDEERNCAFVRDITERKLSEMARQKSEQNFRTIIDVSPMPLAMNDSLGNITYLNKEFVRIIGYNTDDIPRLEEWWPRAYPDQQYRQQMLDTWMRHLNESKSSGQPFEPMEINIVCKDTSVRSFICSATSIEENFAGNTLVVFYDITERKRGEAERIAFEQQFQQTQKLESLGVLAGGIAHDFNNILMSIIGNADLALMRINKESPIIENLHRIEQAAARAADLAKQMLAYSGKGKFVVENINLNILLEEMLHILEVSISKKAVLRLNQNNPLPTVEADATQMRQIIMNLVINASEAIGDKSGVIAINTGCMHCDRNYLKNVWLDEHLTDGLYVYLEIADTGCGMDKTVMAKLFDPFFTTKFTGRGLGMAAVLGIVRGHKGAIKVYSEPNKGTSFKILLPASDRPAELFNEDSGHDDWKGSGTVLLVDDEETVRSIGKEMLQELGFTAITANDGRDALDIFKTIPAIDFVILDLTMPHIDGEQCFRELKQLKPDVKVIISSGYNEQEVTQKFVGKGLAGFIQKPYKLSVLKEAIRKIT